MTVADIRQGSENFLRQYEYDENDITAIMWNFDLTAQGKVADLLIEHAENYRAEVFDYTKLATDAASASETVGLTEYECRLVFLLALLPYTETYFRKAGANDRIIRDSLLDFKWKLDECKKIYGTRGIFSSWMGKWLTAERFALGRLEFELTPALGEYKKGTANVKIGDTVIGVHIPSNSLYPFNSDTCREAYRQAHEFFSPKVGAPIIFECCSWMTWEENLRLLPSTSKIREFAANYDIVSTSEAMYHAWRIFGTMDMSDPAKLPERTMLQRIYKKILTSGGSICASLGYFCYEDKFLNTL